MPDGGWTRYKLQRKLFAIGEDFWIENDKGEPVFKVDGKALSLARNSCSKTRTGLRCCPSKPSSSPSSQR